MKKNRKLVITYLIIVITFSITFKIGIFQNPNFNLYDFFSGLSTELLGMVFAILVIETYVSERISLRKKENKTDLQNFNNSIIEFCAKLKGENIFDGFLYNEIYDRLKMLVELWNKQDTISKQVFISYN